jgi:hypothetical protein
MTKHGRRFPSPSARGADSAIGVPVHALRSIGPCPDTAWVVLAA